jgi:hypothetical protein
MDLFIKVIFIILGLYVMRNLILELKQEDV